MNFISATLYVIQNPVILIGLQIIGIIVFALIGTKFLIKAPIKDYAHDLIQYFIYRFKKIKRGLILIYNPLFYKVNKLT